MQPSVIVWDLETVPDLGGFAAANDLVGKSDVEVREAIGDKFPKHIYHSITRATNKFFGCSHYQGDIPETSAPVPLSGFPSCPPRRCAGRELTASEIRCSLTADEAGAYAC
jgi:hypothetical protein